VDAPQRQISLCADADAHGVQLQRLLQDDEAVAVVGAGLFASLVSSLLAVVVLVVAGRWIAGEVLRAPAAYATLWLVPLGMFGAGAADVLSGWCLRHRSFDALVRLRVSRSVGIAAGQVVTAILARASAVGLALGDAAGRVYSAVEMGVVVRRAERARGGRFTWAATKAALWRYREFPFVSAPSTMINAIGLWAPVFLLLAAFAALTYITAILLVAVFALPLLINLVAAHDYPDLGRHGENVFWGSLGNTLGAGAIFLIGSLAMLPLLLIPGALLVLPLLWSAWLNQRAFRFDALAEHATRSEMQLLVREDGRSFYMAGLATAAIAYVPLLNLLAPAFAALVFVHLGLAALRRRRQEGGVVL